MRQVHRTLALHALLVFWGTLASTGCGPVGDGSDPRGAVSDPITPAVPPPNRIFGLSPAGAVNRFVSLDPTTGAVTVISQLPAGNLNVTVPSTYDPARHRYIYLASQGGEEHLFAVDVSTGETVGDVVVPAIGALAIDAPTGDVLCRNWTPEDGATITRVNPMTGTMAVVSSLALHQGGGPRLDVFDGDSVYYGVDGSVLDATNAYTGAWAEMPLSPAPTIAGVSSLQYDDVGTGTRRLFGTVLDGPYNDLRVVSIDSTTGDMSTVQYIADVDHVLYGSTTFDPVYNRFFFIGGLNNPQGVSMWTKGDRIFTVDVDTGATQGLLSPPVGGPGPVGDPEPVFSLQYERSARTAPPSGLLINEIDYDQPGVDTAEYIEVYNGSAEDVYLGGYELLLVNGANSTVYSTLYLGVGGTLAPGEYLVVGSGPALASVPETAKTIYLGNGHDYFQNGSPDGVALYDTYTNTIVDAVSYEGSIESRLSDVGMVNLVEGTPLSVWAADSSSVVESLCRRPNGVDTNDANTDWSLCTTLTPGAPNQ